MGKEIIGMIHCAGSVAQALEEIAIYAGEGLDGAIIENYHGSIETVIAVLDAARSACQGLRLGVNILPNGYALASQLVRDGLASFVQLDHVAGTYRQGSFDGLIDPAVPLYGGVWPKYYVPVAGSDFATDLRTALGRAYAVVITGAGTGMETPISKLQYARSVIGNHPLIVGAGVTARTCRAQLAIADGCIVGSAFKEATYLPVEVARVREFMRAARF